MEPDLAEDLAYKLRGPVDYLRLGVESLNGGDEPGYLYDAALDGGAVGVTGSGATHAWLQVFLPGAGWLDYDPTNQISAGFDLIPVAVARHPAQAIPLEGSWFGEANDYLGMTVNVAVQKIGNAPDLSAR